MALSEKHDWVSLYGANGCHTDLHRIFFDPTHPNAMNARDPQQAPQQNAQWNARRLAATPRGVGVMTDRYAARAENAPLISRTRSPVAVGSNTTV